LFIPVPSAFWSNGKHVLAAAVPGVMDQTYRGAAPLKNSRRSPGFICRDAGSGMPPSRAVVRAATSASAKLGTAHKLQIRVRYAFRCWACSRSTAARHS
jgi:hypothetical protein